MDDMTVRKALKFIIAMAAGLFLADHFPIFGQTPIGLATSAGFICLIANIILTPLLRIK
jgi:hypothetical protein